MVRKLFFDPYCIWDNRLVSENNILYYCFVTFYVERRCCHPNMKPIRYFIFERDVHLFLASSCSNDYFHAYAIIYFLANRLVFQNMVTYSYRIFVLSKFLLIHLRLTEVLHKVTACLIKFCPNRTKASFAWQLAIVQMTSCMCYLHVNNFISRDFSSCQLLPCTCSASRVKRSVLVYIYVYCMFVAPR